MGRLKDRLEQQAPPKQSLLEGIKEDIGKRYEAFGRIADVTKLPGGYSAEARQELPSGVLQTAGQAAGLLGDIVGRGVSAVLPDPLEEKIGGAVSAVAQTAPAQEAIKAYQQFKKEHPEAAANIEAATNIVSLSGVPKVAGVGLKTSGTVAGRLGRGLEASGKRALVAEKGAFAYRLVKPLEDKKVRIESVARTSEKGFGAFKRSVVAPTKAEIASQRAVLEIPGVSGGKTLQQNYNIIRDYNVDLARNLEGTLKKNDFIFPKKELASRLRIAKEELTRSPLLVGNEGKIADKLIAELERRINKAGAKGSELLRVRKDYDSWIQKQKPKVFDAKAENAFTVTNRTLRKTINDFLDEKAPSARVKKSFRKQTALFDALENIAPKAALEANTAIGRAFQRMTSVLGTKNKTVQIVAAATGIGGLGAAATFAPAVAVLGIGGFVIFKSGKFVLRPQIRIAVGKILKEYERISGKQAALEVLRDIEKSISDLNEIYK